MGRNTFRSILFLLFLSTSGTLLAQSAPQNNAPDAQGQGASGQNSPDQGASDQGAGDQGSGDQNANAPAATASAPAPTPTRKSFVVNGKAVNAEVLVVDGRSYVDIDSLAQIATITNGSLTVEPNRISLTIPVEGGEASTAAAANAPAENTPPPSLPGFSKPFVSSAIGALAEMREWKATTGTMITYGLAMSDAWAQGYQSRAQDELAQAMLAATTDDDRSALALLQNEYNTLASWSGQTMAARQALNGAPTIDPNTLANDTTLAKINACGDFLSSMLLSGTFSDNANCH